MGAAEHRRVAYFSHLLFQNLHAANHICCQNTLSFHHTKEKKRNLLRHFPLLGENLVFPQFLSGSWIYCRDVHFISKCMWCLCSAWWGPRVLYS